MRIVEASLERLRLEMVRPLRTAAGVYAAREGFVVRLVDDAGRVGWGEAMPLAEFGTETPEACERVLTALLPELRDAAGPPLPGPWAEGGEEHFPANHPAARHALEQACLDLLAQRRGLPCASSCRPGRARRSTSTRCWAPRPPRSWRTRRGGRWPRGMKR